MTVIQYDIRGQICPATLLIALKEINEHSEKIGEGALKLSFKTDNRDAVVTIPESAANMGYTVSVDKKEGYYLIEISGG